MLLALSAAVVFVTTYALVFPAITLDQEEAISQGGIDVPAAEQLTEEPGEEEAAGEATAQTLEFAGDGYTVSADYEAEAGLPEDTKLVAREILQEEEDYAGLYEQAERAVRDAAGDENRALQFARFYDISLMSGEQEMEPADTVNVKISYDQSIPASGDVQVIHFTEAKKGGKLQAQILDPESTNLKIKKDRMSEAAFEADSFSVYAVVSSGQTSNLNGQTFAIINTNTNEAVLNETQAVTGGTRLKAAGVTIEDDGGKSYVHGGEVSMWTFTQVSGNYYYIQDENGKYMSIPGQDGIAGLSNTPQPIQVIQNGNQVRLYANNRALNAWNSRVSDGFGGGRWPGGPENFTLFDLEQVISSRADKESVTDLVNMYSQENPIQEVIIYIRQENAQKDGYDYYAVAADGSLVKVYDVGDTIGWTLPDEGESLKWDMTVHVSEGAPNGYFDFKSQKTGQYLIPSPDGILKDDDPGDAWDLGVNMKGWSAGDYGSPIERWDTDSHSYIGYTLDSTGTKLVPYTGEGKELEFFFAVVDHKSETEPNKLHPVETLDGKTKGITIKMYDFDGWNRTSFGVPRSQEMTNLLGPDSQRSTNINGIGYANKGLVSETLDANGFPTATLTGRSFSTLFNDRHLESDASNLFVKQTYDETGYFTYDSSQNYAYLDQDQDKFILYREVAAPEMEQPTTPSGNKGNFFPFDSLQALADADSVFTDRTVKYDGDLNRLTPDHPQYGDKLYKVPDDGARDGYASYFFGMTMEANFYQGPDGKDAKGNDIIYEFNGDDDMWLYIDDLLVLDIGGCHGAVSGTINFSTGEVHVHGPAGHETNTTLKDIFRNANNGAGILPDGSPWTGEGAAKFFRGNTFADYTQHSFKMFYMERGAYASNLKVNFNLLTVEPDTFVLEKKLPDNVQSAYADEWFYYQIYTIDEHGNEVLYEPPMQTDGSERRHVTYEDTGERVVPAGHTESPGFKPSYTIDGKTYSNVYCLKPDQAIVLPVDDKKTQYYVREIGIDTNVYEHVTVNGANVPITTTDPVSGENLAPTNLAATTVDTVQSRGRVTYRNIPKEDHVHNLRLRKVIDSPVTDDSASFRFDVQLESSATGQLVPYNTGVYYIVKTDANGHDHYYKFENNQLVESENNTPVPYEAGISGSISKITPDYTILIKGLLAGTDFKVTENQSQSEMPEGYEYVRTDVEHAGAADPNMTGSQGTIQAAATTGEGQRQDALVTITNRPTGSIIVEKEWNSGEFVSEHGSIYVALYEKAGQAGSETLTLVDGSVKKLEYNSGTRKYQARYNIKKEDLSKYTVREVQVRTDQDGKVTEVLSYAEDGGRIVVTGEKAVGIGDQAAASGKTDTYIVDYEEGTASGGSRTDKIKNTLPKVSLYKINENTSGQGKQYLSGAVFALEDQAGNPVKNASDQAITFTSNGNGMLFENQYFSNGTYYLKETKAPDGYNMLEHRIVLTVSDSGISAAMEAPGTTQYINQSQDTTGAEFRFEVMNNPGVALPESGGPGTTWIYLIGTVLLLGCGITLAARRRLTR